MSVRNWSVVKYVFGKKNPAFVSIMVLVDIALQLVKPLLGVCESHMGVLGCVLVAPFLIQLLADAPGTWMMAQVHPWHLCGWETRMESQAPCLSLAVVASGGIS